MTFARILCISTVAGATLSCGEPAALGPPLARQPDELAIAAIVELKDDVPEWRLKVGVEDLPELKSDRDLVAAVSAAGGRVWIGLKPESALRTRASGVVPAISRTVALGAREAVAGRFEIVVERTFARSATVVALIRPEDAPSIRELDAVDYLEPVEPYRIARTARSLAVSTLSRPLAPGDSIDWGLQLIGAPLIWSQTGNGGGLASISILDSGVDETHFGYDLPATLECFYDSETFENTPQFQNCHDQGGHGTHVAGIAFASADGGGVVGVAPWIDRALYFKVCWPTDGVCFPDAAASALAWLQEYGPSSRHVINLSWGGETVPTYLIVVLEQLYYESGALIVAVGGNRADGNYSGLDYPARLATVIAVTGSLQGDNFAGPTSCGGGSRYGPEAELAAPFIAYSTGLNGTHLTDCGTSVSAPFVSGAAALVWTQYPNWTNVQVRNRLRLTSVDKGISGHDHFFGFGRVSVAVAASPPVPMTVQIAGPSQIRPGAACTWSAVVSGGSGLLAFTWRQASTVVGTGVEFTGPVAAGVTSPFLLTLTASDGGGDPIVAQLTVTESPNAPLCMQ